MSVAILLELYIPFLVTLLLNVLFITIFMIKSICFVLSITFLVFLNIFNTILVFDSSSFPILLNSILWRKQAWLSVILFKDFLNASKIENLKQFANRLFPIFFILSFHSLLLFLSVILLLNIYIYCLMKSINLFRMNTQRTVKRRKP